MGKETAEQKLLKLIESPSSPALVKAPGQDVATQIAAAVRSHGFLGRTIPFSLRPFHFSFGLREVNKLLLVAMAVILVFLLSDFLNGTKSLQKKIDLTVDFNTAKTSSNIILPAKDLSDYLDVAQERNVFQPVEKKVVKEKEKSAEESPASPKKIVTLAEKLKLVGVSWVNSAETASAMIEDTESGITYFVHQGENIKGFTVKTIYANQVVLTWGGEEITIGL